MPLASPECQLPEADQCEIEDNSDRDSKREASGDYANGPRTTDGCEINHPSNLAIQAQTQMWSKTQSNTEH